MDEFEDIIDLEEENNLYDEIVDLEDDSIAGVEENSSMKIPQPARPTLSKFQTKQKDNQAIEKLSANKEKGFQKPVLGKNNVNSKDADKLKNLGNKNFTSLLSNKGNNNNEVKSPKDKIKEKATGKVIEHLSKGAVKGETAEKIGGIALKAVGNKSKIYMAIAAGAMIFLVIIVVLVSSVVEETKSGNFEALGYVLEEEGLGGFVEFLFGKGDDSLENSEYGMSSGNLESEGSYKIYNKLKSTYNDYKSSCGSVVLNNNPCGVTINPALILETINYFHLEFEAYESDYDSENTTEESFSFESLLDELFGKYKEFKATEQTLSAVTNLALAQAEFVEETCEGKTEKYYQVSFDKYISYLKYGETSSHPNYNGQARKISNEVCVGPTNDYITLEGIVDELSEPENELSGEENKIAGSGINVDIVNYALQFVGNPYVWGGTSLTNGADCSGFTQSVMKHFGINIPKWSGAQAVFEPSIGTDASVALPGDIICYDGHVAIYMGNNKIVHASNSKPYPQGGIKVDDLPNRKIVSIIRAWD